MRHCLFAGSGNRGETFKPEEDPQRADVTPFGMETSPVIQALLAGKQWHMTVTLLGKGHLPFDCERNH
jgi:hypothetical protein